MAKALTAEEKRWPATAPSWRDTKSLKPNPDNPRKHSPEQIEAIGRIFDKAGWTTPILIDDADMIIAGEGRWRMAQLRKIVRVPVIVAKGWTEEQKRAYQIADNRVSELSEWDTDALDRELEELAALGTSRADLGFEAPETDADPIAVREVDTGEVVDEFWISVRGPLKHQAGMLRALEDASLEMSGVVVEQGTIQDR